LGIGVDALPKEIRNSTILTGNDLGLLANVEALPNAELVQDFAKTNPQLAQLSKTEKHKKAQEFLKTNHITEAWLTLLTT